LKKRAQDVPLSRRRLLGLRAIAFGAKDNDGGEASKSREDPEEYQPRNRTANHRRGDAVQDCTDQPDRQNAQGHGNMPPPPKELVQRVEYVDSRGVTSMQAQDDDTSDLPGYIRA